MSTPAGPGNQTDVKHIKDGAYFHANTFLRLEVPQVESKSSLRRAKRAAELPVRSFL